MTAAGEMETGLAEVNGTRLYYEVAGVGHPLVLVHAGIADNTMWDDQFPAFAERYRVVRFDMRGYGRSPKPPAPYAVRGDLHAMLQHLGIKRTYLLGCSMGGSSALDFTLEYPDMVDALILVGAGVSGYDPQPDDLAARWEEIEAAFEAGDLARATELETRMWVDGPNRPPDAVDPAVRARAYTMGLRVNQGYTEEGVEQPLDPPAADRLGEIRVPTLVIVGDQDVPDILETSNVLTSRITGARKVVIPNTAHLPNMEQPALFNRTVLDFLGAL
jgi:pimeloyl-ACP methyl ester carboxylesterase